VETHMFLMNCISHTMTDESTGPEDKPRKVVPSNKEHAVEAIHPAGCDTLHKMSTRPTCTLATFLILLSNS
jgi:hypothetical protein